MKKLCSICNQYKEFSCFYKSKGGLFGLHTYCKECLKEYRNSRPKKKCIECSKIKLVDKNTDLGPLCSACNSKKNLKVCDMCNELRPVDSIKNNVVLCKKCSKKNRKEICSMCNSLRAVDCRIDNNPICGECQKNNRKKICVGCAKLKPMHGNGFCYQCYKKDRMENDKNFRIKELIRNRIGSLVRKLNIKKVKGVDVGKIIKHLGPCPGDLKDYHIDHIFPLSAFNLKNEREFLMAFSPQNHQWLSSFENLSKHAKFDEIEFNIFKRSF